MSKSSSGILAWRKRDGELEVLLVHPGGPFFARKDEGAWSIPKGEFGPDEDALVAACREFEEELGVPPTGVFTQLKPVKQKGGKTVYAWALKTDIDVALARSNTFSMEWPPKSGKMREFPEVDKAEWFAAGDAKKKINVAQAAFLDELADLVG